MSVFLTPELQPFLGGTYYPPADAYGRPGKGGKALLSVTELKVDSRSGSRWLQPLTSHRTDRTRWLGVKLLFVRLLQKWQGWATMPC